MLRRRLGGLDGRRIALAFAKVLGAALFMAAVAWGAERWLAALMPGSSLLPKLVRVGGGIAAGLAGLWPGREGLQDCRVRRRGAGGAGETPPLSLRVATASAVPLPYLTAPPRRPARRRLPQPLDGTVLQSAFGFRSRLGTDTETGLHGALSISITAIIAFQFGPGPMTPAVKLLIWAKMACFVGAWLLETFTGIRVSGPGALAGGHVRAVVGLAARDLHVPARARSSHPLQHAGSLDVRQRAGAEWGAKCFLQYYFVTGIGAGVMTLLLAFVPGAMGKDLWANLTVGASGAIYGVLLAYALWFPNRPILLFFLFPVPAKIAVMIFGAMAFLFSISETQAGWRTRRTSGGWLVGYLYLKVWRTHPLAEVKYRYVKWQMNRLRRKFDVHTGGRSDWDRHVH